MIGIAITTRNRPEDLDLCLRHFEAFPPSDKYKIVISDDSDQDKRQETEDVVAKNWKLENISLMIPSKRLGIAKNKNVGLLNLQGCDYIFLFDDDSFPRKQGWDDLFIDSYARTGVHHMMFLAPFAGNFLMKELNGIEEYNLSWGCMLFLTQYAFKAVGYFDRRFNIYGYEHCQYSDRIYRAGLTNGYGRWLTPKGSRDYIYTIDLHFNHGHEFPPIGELPQHLRGSLEFTDVAPFIQENSRFFNSPYPIHMNYD